MAEESQSSSKAVLIVIVAIIILLGVAIVVKGFVKHQRAALTYQTTHAVTQTVTATLTPISMQHAVTTNNSDTQLNQDEKDIQDNLNKLNSDVTNVDQGFSNASADTPQQ